MYGNTFVLKLEFDFNTLILPMRETEAQSRKMTPSISPTWPLASSEPRPGSRNLVLLVHPTVMFFCSRHIYQAATM